MGAAARGVKGGPQTASTPPPSTDAIESAPQNGSD
jgi:hypothetical protein